MPLFMLDSPISYPSCPAWRPSKGHPSWVQCYYGRTPEYTLLTCDQGNFNHVTARSRNRTIVTVVRDTCTTTVASAPPLQAIYMESGQRVTLTPETT